jgi:predicted PurR-regulated permease PerM
MPSAAAVRFFLLLALLATALVLVVASPFASGLFLAAVLAAALLPVCDALTRRSRGRASLAAGLTVLLTFLAVMLPLALLTGLLLREILDASQSVAGIIQREGLAGLVTHLPSRLQGLAREALDRTPQLVDRLQSSLGQALSVSASVAGTLLVTMSAWVLQAIALLIALYLFLLEGRHLLSWLARISPLGHDRTHALFAALRQVSVSVVGTSLVVAFVQALLALAGFLVARAPNPVLLSFATFFMAFIPALGGAFAVAFVGLAFLLAGATLKGVVLVAYAILVVGSSDNVLKPLLIKGESLSGGVTFFALLGGVAVFGPIGLVIGPLSVALLLALTRMYEAEGGAKWLDAGLTAATLREPPAPAPEGPEPPAERLPPAPH